jgi:carbamoyltransferase
MRPLKKFGTSGSLGWAYGAATEALGWWVGDGEGKTMALAPYGDPERAMGDLEPLFPRYLDGELSCPHDFGVTQHWNENGAYHWHFVDAVRLKESMSGLERADVAGAAQELLERNMVALLQGWLARTGARHLCCAGGVFLNVKLNWRLRQELDVEALHVFPNAGDAGLAVGAALHVSSTESPAEGRDLPSVCWGPAYRKDEIQGELKRRKLRYAEPPDLARCCAGLLAQGDVVAWFQGPMESGPRALGGRSILMDPRRAEHKDVLNLRVKRREGFRPFCPSILAERADAYLEGYVDERFMINAFQVRPALRSRIPAVVHVDGSTRPQAVHRSVNPLFWSLITEFDRLTGVPALLNTSLNLAGEPMACSPSDAIRCFWDSGMDHLAIGPFLVSKQEPAGHAS